MLFQRILIPTDGSELSEKASHHGIEFAKNIGAAVVAYYCQAEFHYALYSEYILESPSEFQKRTQQLAKNYLEKIEALAKQNDIVITTEISTFDSPYLGIIDAAQRLNCDLILMASHGRRGLSSLLLGSETQKVLIHSKIPVLVYR